MPTTFSWPPHVTEENVERTTMTLEAQQAFVQSSSAMIANEDRQRLLESRHDIGAAANLATITSDTTYQASIGTARGNLGTRRTELLDKANAYSIDKSETDAERAGLAAACDEAVHWYDYIRNRAETRLLKPAPNVKVTAHEMERRRKLFDRVFAISPSDFGRLSTGAAIETWGTVAEALGKEPDLEPLHLADDMGKAHAAAVNAAQSLNREVDEDSAAMNALRAARGAFDRAARAYARIIEGVLVHEGTENDLGRYVLARDPAYAARRQANVPITEEPGADVAETAP